MSKDEMVDFLKMWEREARTTLELLKTIPEDRYEFRPDPKGRSLSELAWHLAELEAVMTNIALKRDFGAPMPPEAKRPRTVPELVAGYENVHREAVQRVTEIRPEDLDREFPFFGGQTIRVRDVLRYPLLHHLIHHRGQLMMMIRLAEGVPARVYGPNREESRPVR